MEIALRFLVGGLIVSAFALLADALKPKSFAGLLGAAPSVALATLGITVIKDGTHYAALEARSMLIGVIAFFVSACWASRQLIRSKRPTLAIEGICLVIWLGVALGVWYLVLG